MVVIVSAVPEPELLPLLLLLLLDVELLPLMPEDEAPLLLELEEDELPLLEDELLPLELELLLELLGLVAEPLSLLPPQAATARHVAAATRLSSSVE